MEKKPIPAWAAQGAKLLLEPGGYTRERRFIPVVVTRVTKASVFVIYVDEPRGERRFVPMNWTGEDDRLEEYGRGSSWSPNAYVWNPEADRVKELVAHAAVRELELKLAQAAQDLAEIIRRNEHPDTTKRIETLKAALDALANYKGRA